MADILSKQYTSVFSIPKPEYKVQDPITFFSNTTPEQYTTLTDITFTPDDVEQALGELKPTSASGPRGWSAFLLHTYKGTLAAPLHTMWRRSLDTGDMPEGINLAFISPIFKGGEKSEPANYRPIA